MLEYPTNGLMPVRLSSRVMRPTFLG